MADDRVAPTGGGDLVLEGLTKRFGDFVAVDDLDLTVPEGQFFALLGPSGCGKTTTLRMVAGLEDPTSGSIRLGAEDITHRKPYRRPVNTVFQSYALFPHLTIFENVAFGLRRQKRKDVKGPVRDMLELIELSQYADRKPTQLSGGQQQRVALGRALINNPQVLLLDEPLGALDLKLRRQMQLELKRIQTEVGLTFVHVTHDQEEAMTMADTVAVMNAGVIEQMGSPVELYEKPRTTFVANFLGQSNLLRGTVRGSDARSVSVEVEGARLLAPRDSAAATGAETGEVWIGVRPEKIYLAAAGTDPGDDSNTLRDAVVVDVSFIGVSTQYVVRMPWGQTLTVFEQNTGARDRFGANDKVDLHWMAAHSFLLDASQDANAGVESEEDL